MLGLNCQKIAFLEPAEDSSQWHIRLPQEHVSSLLSSTVIVIVANVPHRTWKVEGYIKTLVSYTWHVIGTQYMGASVFTLFL